MPHVVEQLDESATRKLSTSGPLGSTKAVPTDHQGELRSLLKDAFELEFYKERKVGPQGCGAVVVQLLARRK